MENTNEMMAIEEIENNEEITETGENYGAKTLVGVGVAGLVLGALVHKYAKPIAKKVRSKFTKKDEIVEDNIIEADFEYIPEKEDN